MKRDITAFALATTLGAVAGASIVLGINAKYPTPPVVERQAQERTNPSHQLWLRTHKGAK